MASAREESGMMKSLADASPITATGSSFQLFIIRASRFNAAAKDSSRKEMTDEAIPFSERYEQVRFICDRIPTAVALRQH